MITSKPIRILGFGSLLVASLFYVSTFTSAEHTSKSDDYNHHLPAGSLSASNTGADTFLQPFKGIGLEEGLNYRVGQALFEKLWVFAPSSTQASDGLGPLYNARSCAQCHVKNGRAKLDFSENLVINPVGLVIRLNNPEFGQDPFYGTQIQPFAYPNGQAEANLEIHYSTQMVSVASNTSVSLFEPRYTLSFPSNHSLHPSTQQSPRMAGALIGLGLIESIDDEDILKWADPNDTNNDGISGRPNYVPSRDTNSSELGRFGWKSGQATLAQQNANALHTDIGVGSKWFPSGYGDCTEQQTDCLAQAHGNTEQQDGYEASDKVMQSILYFTSMTSVPKRVNLDDKGIKGQQLFSDIGCADCHRPSYTLDSKIQALPVNETIWPYSDFLLHDMGEKLADGFTEHQANGSEWRTPPLWGLAYQKQVNQQLRLLHDGRARTVTEAILWHGGEARKSKTQFVNLSESDQNHLIQFVESL